MAEEEASSSVFVDLTTSEHQEQIQHSETPKQLEERAISIYQKAVDFEKQGKIYDALPFYKKAVQLVPDIEFRFHELEKNTNVEYDSKGSVEGKKGKPKKGKKGTEPQANLFKKFRSDLMRDYGGQMIQNNFDPEVICTQMHFSDLPPEIIFKILRWVVSSEMDMYSLEQTAAVSRGMYLYARDEQIWHSACVKIWGSNVGFLKKPLVTSHEVVNNDNDSTRTPIIFRTWRNMFIERERVLFNGCYVSKTSYLRVGSNDFQDQYYSPIQLVEYYRYIRFLPDGRVFMRTSATSPTKGVQKLRNINEMPADVLQGKYTLCGSTINIAMKKIPPKQQKRNNDGSCQRNIFYRIEFRIMPSDLHKCGLLRWVDYEVTHLRGKDENTTKFELILSQYPPLNFTLVESYHKESEAPLE